MEWEMQERPYLLADSTKALFNLDVVKVEMVYKVLEFCEWCLVCCAWVWGLTIAKRDEIIVPIAELLKL